MHQCITPVKSARQNAAVHNPYSSNTDPRAIITSLYKTRGFRSIRALAIAAGIPQPTLSRYMKGDTQDMGLGHFRAIADALELTVSQLLGETPIHDDPRVDRVLRVMERLPGPGRAALVATANALADSLEENQ